MSLQDDIFDVADALKKLPESGQFDNIMDVFNEMERDLEKARHQLSRLKAGALAIRELFGPLD